MSKPPPHGARSGPEEQRMQGHWLLAKLGKRVLRPGGIELTNRLIANASPAAGDRIIEFGPGVGRTASVLLAANPRTYIAVDPNPQGTSALLKILANYPQARLERADAKTTRLPDECADLVVGEAMLSMQSDADKLDIMREAYRILAPGGRYAIHELGIRPDDASREFVQGIAKSLSRSIKVGARPLTVPLWSELLTEAGFCVHYADTNPMHLLEPKRIISDEGLKGALTFFFNVARNRAARKRIIGMRQQFRKHGDNLQAVAFVAIKPGEV